VVAKICQKHLTRAAPSCYNKRGDIYNKKNAITLTAPIPFLRGQLFAAPATHTFVRGRSYFIFASS